MIDLCPLKSKPTNFARKNQLLKVKGSSKQNNHDKGLMSQSRVSTRRKKIKRREKSYSERSVIFHPKNWRHED